MYSTKKSLLFNPSKSIDEISRHLTPDEKIIGIFSLPSAICIFTPLRIAKMAITGSGLDMNIPMSEVVVLIENDNRGEKPSQFKLDKNNVLLKTNPLKNPLINPLSIVGAVKAASSFSVQLTNDEIIPLGMFGKTDWPSVRAAFEEAFSQRDEMSEIKLSTPETRKADFARIESNIIWSKVPGHLQKNIEANISNEETPSFIITSIGSMSGSLIALSDRCLIVKSGGIAGFMAGSLGGARVASFYYQDITGIEFNSGMVTGVVEILTPSYDGSKNKDYWKGTNKSRNSDSNDPWTLSNCLPMNKIQYNQAKIQFDKLRSLIGKSKGSSNVTNIINSDSVADEIEKLAKLLEKNLIDADEFKEAKNRLLGK